MVQWPLVCVISAYLVAFGAHFIKVVEDVVIKKFTFAPSSPDEFLVFIDHSDVISSYRIYASGLSAVSCEKCLLLRHHFFVR